MRLRYALAGVFLLLLGQVELSGRVTITLVDDVYSPAQVNDNVITIANVQSGDVVAVIAGVASNTNTITITDNDPGNSWTACPVGNIDHITSASIRMVAAITTATAAMTTITLTSSGSSATYGAAVAYRGMGTASCDATDTDNNDDDEQSHGDDLSVAPTTTNDTVLFGGIGLSTIGTFSATPSGYTEVGSTFDRFWAGHKAVNSTSANTFEATSSANRDSVGVLMAIKSGSAAGSTLRKLLLMGIGS